MANEGLSREQRIRNAEELVRVADDRFSYHYALKLTLETLGADRLQVQRALECAQQRNFQEVLRIVRRLRTSTK